jgi:glutaredoxin|tara:strand:+ start:13313 stop:13909 length:597 start_codon:yes stop_codon:yes gene_type:complete
MENLFLNWGWSHTMSKLTPYLLLVILGILLMRFILKSSRIKNKIAKISVAVLLLLAPFGVYFAVNPIYQGDFSQNGKDLKIRNAKTTSIDNGLLVLTIPGCPYCFESVQSLKYLKSRNPELKIQFAVTGTDDKSYLEGYKKEVNGSFDVVLYEKARTLVSETGGQFPTFVMIKNGKAIYSWTNDEFGVRAKDKLENWK